jgi:hypothetical protein
MNSEHSGSWPRWARVLAGVWVLAAGVVLGIYLRHLTTEDDHVAEVAVKTTARGPDRGEARFHGVTKTNARMPEKMPSATGGGSNGTTAAPGAVLAPRAEAEFAELEGSIGGQIGVAVAPLGSARPTRLGPLQVGHAWSSFKVPVLVTAMQQGALTPEEQSQAAAAVTASDNEAAAALFARLGDVSSASAAVEGVLSEAGYPTAVATAPPPSGAVSTWGQTEWPLEGAVYFYRALACGQLLDSAGTEYVLGLMESVISEQQWGLGQAGIPAQVAFKAGWGPDGSSSGPYLVRQSGILRSGNSGAVVTIAAQDSSGSFEAGVQDLDAVAGWVRDNVRLDAGTCSS